MDNLQAVSEVLAMYNGMLIRPLWDEIDKQIEQVVTSGNENHYVFWAKQVEDSSGKKWWEMPGPTESGMDPELCM